MITYDNCNRCGKLDFCSVKIEDCWPADDGNYYGRLCRACLLRLNNPVEWEMQRMELVGRHSE